MEKANKLQKVKLSCSKNIIERFNIEKPENCEFEYINYPCSDEELISQCKDADIILCSPVDFFNKKVIDKLDKCKMIHSVGVGFDKIDIQAAKEKGIIVCNNRGLNSQAVAELAINHMINSIRKIPQADALIREKGSEGFKESFRDYQVNGQGELGSKTVGLVGLGGIGKALVKILNVFGCEVIYYDVFRVDEEYEKENNLKYCTYEELLEKSDIISYHVPVLDSTRGMVNKEAIEKMKDNALIINVARGEIVNNEDLADALNKGKIFAGLDVIAPEPPSEDHPLFNLTEKGKARLNITPHIAGTTDDVFKRMVRWTYDDIERLLNGEEPNNIVNK